jgi:hypothetical protein
MERRASGEERELGHPSFVRASTEGDRYVGVTILSPDWKREAQYRMMEENRSLVRGRRRGRIRSKAIE